MTLLTSSSDLEAAFRRHACDLNARNRLDALRTVALDGKTLRGSLDHLTDRKAVHVLSALASDAALILAYQELAGAPDEVTAVPKLMADLGLTGVLFCAAHDAAMEDEKRKQQLAAVTAGWSGTDKRAFLSLQQAAAGFAKAHGDNEVDLSGTARAAMVVNEQQGLETEFRDFLQSLERHGTSVHHGTGRCRRG